MCDCALVMVYGAFWGAYVAHLCTNMFAQGRVQASLLMDVVPTSMWIQLSHHARGIHAARMTVVKVKWKPLKCEGCVCICFQFSLARLCFSVVVSSPCV